MTFHACVIEWPSPRLADGLGLCPVPTNNSTRPISLTTALMTNPQSSGNHTCHAGLKGLQIKLILKAPQ